MDRYKQELVVHLSRFVKENRLAQFQRVLSERTRYVTVVLEDIYQSQNASAILRTCECTGIQDVHIIEKRNEYTINPDVALGSDKWLTLHYYNDHLHNTSVAIQTLKKEGYRIVATSPHREGTDPDTFNLGKGKAAFLFGTELNGLSDEALEMADECVQIPIVGFTESLNISVSVAILLNQLRKKMADPSVEWRMKKEEKLEILLKWLRTSVKKSELIEKEFKRDFSATF